MFTDEEQKLAEKIKHVASIFYADREAREVAAQGIKGPFYSGLLVFCDDDVVAEARTAYVRALKDLDMVGEPEPPELAQHYKNMIELLLK